MRTARNLAALVLVLLRSEGSGFEELGENGALEALEGSHVSHLVRAAVKTAVHTRLARHPSRLP